ncbi:unnamed protein product [Spirodela intermedia]|uniref:AT-hook motif nuclear-localized protein n=1 Tax=Spirodela intermedia TaxID=51605 RepID=A0A7I8L488_SPIIN|nr:unnamed protein product [Spirodela intermedia]
MEGSGNGFPYYYAHPLSPFGRHQGGVDSGDAVGRAFSSPSPAASAGREGAVNPLLFPQSPMAAAAAGGRAPAPAVEPVRRKRGRPRKYGPPLPSSSHHLASSVSPAVSVSLSFSPLSFSAKPSSSTSLTLASSSPPPQAPPRRRSQDEFLGKGVQSFTPHFLTVAAGEDVVQRIMSFVQKQNRAVCIISASGTIANVTLRQPAVAGGQMTYKGNFDILSLSGSFLISENGGASARTGALSVCLSEEGFLVGGGIGGPLVAATTVQVFAGSFVIDAHRDLDAVANTSKAVSSLSTHFPVGTEESPSVGFHATAGSAGSFSNNRLTGDHHHHQSTDIISRSSSLMQTRAVHVTPQRSSTEWGGGLHYLTLPVVFLIVALFKLITLRMHFL